MRTRFRYSDKFGCYTLEKRGLIARASFSGAFGATMLKEFDKNIKELATSFQPHYWGYLSFSKLAEAANSEAEAALTQLLSTALALGCRAEAHCLSNPLIIEQTRRARIRAGITSPIEDILFDSEEEAEKHILSVLNKINKNV